MTTTAPVYPAGFSPSEGVPVPETAIPKPPARHVHFWHTGIGILTFILGFHGLIRILPIPQDHSFQRERVTVSGITLSPVAALTRLDEHTQTNTPPASFTISPPDYVRIIPASIGNLKELTTLTIYNQPIHALPDTIGHLTKLRTLIIVNTPITRLPDSIGNLTQLEDLEIVGTNIRQLPDSIGNLRSLKALVLAYNRINQLPDSMTQLENLVELDLTGNNLRSTPKSLPANLTFIFLGANPIPIQEIQTFKRVFPAIKGVHH